MAKLNKAQREFFDRFAKNVLVNTIVMDMHRKGLELSGEVFTQIQELVAKQNVDSLVDAVSAAMLERVDFKTLAKVDKFLNTEEAKLAVQVASEVGALAQDEVYEIISGMFSAQDSEKE